MSPISSLAQNFQSFAANGASAARSADTDNSSGKVTENVAGLAGLDGGANAAPFSLGNPGFGNRGGAGSFSVSQFLG
jgi:hypothetical protein